MTLSFMKEIVSTMKSIQITLDDELHRRAKTLAYRTGATLTELIRQAIEDRVERLEKSETVQGLDRRQQ